MIRLSSPLHHLLHRLRRHRLPCPPRHHYNKTVKAVTPCKPVTPEQKKKTDKRKKDDEKEKKIISYK